MSNIVIRRLEHEDLDTRVAWHSDPPVCEQMTFDIPWSSAETQEWFSQNGLNRNRVGSCFFAQDEKRVVTRGYNGE